MAVILMKGPTLPWERDRKQVWQINNTHTRTRMCARTHTHTHTHTENLITRPPEILMRHNREVLSVIWTRSSDDKGKHGTPY